MVDLTGPTAVLAGLSFLLSLRNGRREDAKSYISRLERERDEYKERLEECEKQVATLQKQNTDLLLRIVKLENGGSGK